MEVACGARHRGASRALHIVPGGQVRKGYASQTEVAIGVM